MPFGLDVRAFGERESHSAENLDPAIEHLRERMKRAALVRCARKRDVDIGNAADSFVGAKSFQRALQLPAVIAVRASFNNLPTIGFSSFGASSSVAPCGNAPAASEDITRTLRAIALVRGRGDLAQRVVA